MKRKEENPRSLSFNQLPFGLIRYLITRAPLPNGMTNERLKKFWGEALETAVIEEEKKGELLTLPVSSIRRFLFLAVRYRKKCTDESGFFLYQIPPQLLK